MEMSKGLFEILEYGGWVTYPMLAMVTVLWFCLGERWTLLSTSWSAENLCADNISKASSSMKKDDLITCFILDLQQALSSKKVLDPKMVIKSHMQAIYTELKSGKKIIMAIIAAAPLLGLLGTVVGMIETFNSMTDMSLVSKTGGIAGGVSQALITTQMGLVVAIPGVLADRYLNQKENDIKTLLALIEDKAKEEFFCEALQK